MLYKRVTLLGFIPWYAVATLTEVEDCTRTMQVMEAFDRKVVFRDLKKNPIGKSKFKQQFIVEGKS